jgi:hypothetical protein
VFLELLYQAILQRLKNRYPVVGFISGLRKPFAIIADLPER